jgi:PST family polysaccharide transporter
MLFFRRWAVEKQKLVSNFSYLLILQFLTYLFPFITFPYLVNTLGAEKFGLLAFAQSYVTYFMLLTDYGFNLSAVREIAIARDDKQRISEIFSAVYWVKFALLLIGFFFFILTLYIVTKFADHKEVFFVSFGMVIGNILFPVWFFQGMESMRYVTILHVISKTIFTVSIFVVVRSAEDTLWVPLLNALGSCVAGGISWRYIHRDFDIHFCWPGYRQILEQFRNSTQFFLSRVSVSLYTSSNAFVLGLVTNNTIVGYYAIGEKIYSAIQTLYHPIIYALYPYMSKFRNVLLYKKIYYCTIACNFLFSSLLFIFSKEVILFVFGSGVQTSITVLRIFCVCCGIIVPSALLGYPFLAALGYANYANGSVIFGSIIHISLLCILAFASYVTAQSITYTVLVTEATIFVTRIYFVKRFGLWKTQKGEIDSVECS